MKDIDRRRVLGLGGTALAVGLAGCSLFRDTTLPGSSVEGEGEGESVEADAPDAEESNPFGPAE